MPDKDYSYSFDSDSKYCYPDSIVFKNKLGIRDFDKFNMAERSITLLRILEIKELPVSGNFDLNHLRSIRRFIFQDIFEWAGELRTVNISKGTMFCNYEFIVSNADKLFKELRSENYLCGLSMDGVSERLAYYPGGINAIHPFREGNGRTHRIFIQLLALKAGYDLDFSIITDIEMIEASADAFMCDYAKMINIIKNSICTL